MVGFWVGVVIVAVARGALIVGVVGAVVERHRNAIEIEQAPVIRLTQVGGRQHLPG